MKKKGMCDKVECIAEIKINGNQLVSTYVDFIFPIVGL
jgi:hypothetical protein